MTRLDSPLSRSDSRPFMEGQRSRRASVSQHSERRGEREPEGSRTPFGWSNRFSSRNREDDSSSSPPFRHYERGHPLPSTRSPERKATIPFRNPDLGLPSTRRRAESLNQGFSGLSPQRYMPYSNFRRGESQSRGSPRSPSPRSHNVSPTRRAGSSGRRSSASRGHVTSCTSPQEVSGDRSLSRRRGSVASRTSSPPRGTGSYKQSDSRGLSHCRSPSQNSHSLDSEKLYKNLKSIASESDDSQDLLSWSKRSNSNMEIDSNLYYSNNHNGHGSGRSSHRSRRNSGRNSQDVSPPRGGYVDHGQFYQRSEGQNSRNSGYNSRNSGLNSAHDSRDQSPPRKGAESGGHLSPRTSTHSSHRSNRTHSKSTTMSRNSRTDHSQSQGSWDGSTHSLLSPTSLNHSRDTSSLRGSPNQQPFSDSPTSYTVNTETNRMSSDRSRSNIRRGLEAIIFSENKKSSGQDADLPEMTIEDYVLIADIPKSKLYPDEDETIVFRRRPQSQSPRRDYQQQRYSDGRYDYGDYEESEERGRGRERGRDRRERERRRAGREAEAMSESHSTSSVPTQSRNFPRGQHQASNGSVRNARDTPRMQPDIYVVKKGWMSRVDEDGEWRKYWFVLSDAGLSFYRDSEAEETDEPYGEIDLRRCERVVEIEAEKNYGLQIQTRDDVVTLSAMTSRIRRNWIDVLRRSISNRDSPDITPPPDSSSSDKENPVSRTAQQEASPSHLGHHEAGSDDTDPHQDEPDLISSPLTNQREAGEGRDRDHERRLEDRTKWFQEEGSDADSRSRWESVELRKGTKAEMAQIKTPPLPPILTGTDIEKKWADFESLPLGEMRSLSLAGSQAPQSTNEALQREVAFLRQEIESLRRGRAGASEAGPCGPGAPCVPRFEAMEREHKEALERLQTEREKDLRELEKERDRLLRQEAQVTAQEMEAAREAHSEELERARTLAGGGNPSDKAQLEPPSETLSLQRELDGLSERYSQTCVQLGRAQQSTGQRDSDIRRMEREVEQLRQENQELQARLTEEICLMRDLITGQRSGLVPHGNTGHSTAELEMLLRAKESEIEYLQKEISCLRNEVLSLTQEKQTICEQYKEAYVELTGVKGHSEREITSLREHLRLTNAALEEEHHLGNSTGK